MRNSPEELDCDARETPGASDAELRRLVVRFLSAVIALLVAGATVGIVNRVDDEEGEAEPAAPALASGVTDVLRAGGDVAAYVDARRGAVDELHGQHRAAVSFKSYEVLERALAIAAGSQVRALFVAAPGGLPARITPTGLAAWAAAERAAASQDAFEIERILPTVSDPSFRAQYEEDLNRLVALQRGLEAAIESGAGDVAYVFGVEVIATAGALRDIRGDGAVRLVDPVGDATSAATRAVAFRPEETVRVGEPRYRPLSTPSLDRVVERNYRPAEVAGLGDHVREGERVEVVAHVPADL